jgi:cytoskeletal protein CcmA (bactofilin family)
MPDSPAEVPRPRTDRPLLGRGAHFEGLLVLHGAARIDGTMRGRVLGAEVLHIGEGGSVEARIDADEVVVAGRIVGDVTASRRVELKPTARVSGRLAAPRLALAEGCRFDGPCSAGETPGAMGKEPGTA